MGVAEGRILQWTPLKGLGVVLGDDGEEAFVHHTQLTTPGFKNLVTGQRVRYDVKADPRGAQAVNVEALPLYEFELSPEEWRHLEPRLAAEKIVITSRPTMDGWERSRVVLSAGLEHREKLDAGILAVQPAVRSEQPTNPVFVVDFEGDRGYGCAWCAVGAESAEAAEALLQSKLRELIGDDEVNAEIVETQTLAEYEDESGRALPPSLFPKPGDVVQLG
jgi:CspA family cold shock protein